jgi:8-oxo-dGTP diphosphatase
MDTNLAQLAMPGATVPRVDVRVVLFTVSDGQLWVILQRGEPFARLPKGEPMPDEPLDSVATRVLSLQTGVVERYLEQLYSVSQGSQTDWTVTVAYLGLAISTASGPPSAAAGWFEVSDLPAVNSLDWRIVEYALLRLRAKLGYTTIAFHLLPRTFSLSELQHVYEAVLDRRLDKRNFRRRIQSAGILEATGDTRRDGSHRPARLYRFRAAHDPDAYLTPAWATNLEGEQIAT